MRFRSKILLGFMVVVAINAVVLSILCKAMLKPVFISDSNAQMEKYGVEVEETLDESEDEIQSLLTTINVDYAISVYVLDEDLDVLYTHSGDRVRIGKYSRRRIQEMVDNYKKSGQEVYMTEHYDESDHYKRLYYIRGTKDGYYIMMYRTVRGIEQDISIMTKFLYIAICVLAVCCLTLWYGMTRGFTLRMESMSRVTKKMSELDFGEKVDYHSSDEIGVLAESIDHLSEKLEESIADMQTELERKKELIRNISHELKTPITSIRGYAENAQIVGGENEKIDRYCDIIVKECDTLDLLASEMLEMSVLEDGEGLYEMQPLKTGSLFERIRQRLNREFPDHAIAIDFQECQVTGNAYLLERAVFNYLSNAVKYGTPGEEISLNGCAEGDSYVFAVSNSGKEIPPEEQAQIWDIFYKTDRSRKRSGNSYGIGLSIVKRIAEIHGGDVAVECRDGKTTFSLRIPLVGQV